MELICDGESPIHPGVQILTYKVDETTYFGMVSIIVSSDNDPAQMEYMVFTRLGPKISARKGMVSQNMYWYVIGDTKHREIVTGQDAVRAIFQCIRADPMAALTMVVL